jgi:hypothetical protein
LLQPVIGFHQDEEGHWVADLACGHGRHVRHDPPLVSRPWVTDAAGRAAMLGRELECLKCAGGFDGWHVLSLGDAQLADAELARVTAAFGAAFAAAARPPGMALFARHETAGRLHCELKLYFAPAATAAARAAGAARCPRPAPEGLGLVAGGEEAWAALFPER